MPPQPIEVQWQIAADDRLSHVVRSGKAIASPEWGHSVHVEVSGLEPHRWYWYQFRAGNELSPIGRTRTFPRAQSPRRSASIRDCVVPALTKPVCFTAYQHMADEDLDLVMHLGDYIYESPGRDNFVRKHVGGELMTVDDYRNRYAQYRSDPALRAVHALFPFLVVWDDHEVDNNYAGLYQEAGAPVEQFALRRAAGYKAFYEHMPLRRSSIPKGALLQLYRPFTYGTLASISMLDTRQYRTDQPCGDNVQLRLRRGTTIRARRCSGAAQEKWLMDRLDRSRTGWNFLAQQIPMARLDRFAGPERRYSMDKWDGYEQSRARLLRFLGTRKPSNPVTLAGDVHNNWVNDLRLERRRPEDADRGDRVRGHVDHVGRRRLRHVAADESDGVGKRVRALCQRSARLREVRSQAERAPRRLSGRRIRVEARTRPSRPGRHLSSKTDTPAAG